jgi:hypothetical protein
MTKRFIPLILLLFISSVLAAQETGRMETDRPDQTESPVITKKNYIQTEIGFHFIKENELTGFLHPTVLWKYGVAKRFELRLITEFISEETPLLIPSGNDIITGIAPVQIGGKLAFWEEKGLLPKTSLIFHVAPARVGSKKFYAHKWAPDFVFTFQNTLSENIGLGYNLGAEWDGESDTPYWVYTFAPGFNIGKKWYGFIEVFGAIRKNESPQHNLDGGLAYYFNDDLKIDISSGFGITEPAPDWFGGIGLSFRINTKKKK